MKPSFSAFLASEYHSARTSGDLSASRRRPCSAASAGRPRSPPRQRRNRLNQLKPRRCWAGRGFNPASPRCATPASCPAGRAGARSRERGLTKNPRSNLRASTGTTRPRRASVSLSGLRRPRVDRLTKSAQRACQASGWRPSARLKQTWRARTHNAGRPTSRNRA